MFFVIRMAILWLLKSQVSMAGLRLSQRLLEAQSHGGHLNFHVPIKSLEFDKNSVPPFSGTD